jgi:hypothetical protein
MKQKQKAIYYICDHVSKCKIYNRPHNECPHAVKHTDISQGEYENCCDERDPICKGKCEVWKKEKSK